MKESANAQFMSSDVELLEKAASNKLTSPETEEWQIQGSPFKIVQEDGKCFAVWGSGKMTQDFDTPDEVTEWIENNYWNFLITVLTMAMDSRDLYKMEQILKSQKQPTKAEKEAMLKMKQEREEWEQKQQEHTLHMEIERLKKEEEEDEAFQMFH